MPVPTPAVIRYPGYKKTVLQGEEFKTDVVKEDKKCGQNVGLGTLDAEVPGRFDNIASMNLIQNEIRFHAVISEDHKATTKITKFPVQTGFEISNHAIKQNRRITLEGIFSNVVIEGTRAAVQNFDGTNISKTAFEVMESLVQSASVCEVITNLGLYNPVVFTSFQTKQAAGMVDSILVTMVGEEIQIAENVAKSAPKKLLFEEVPLEARQSVIDKLTESGVATEILPNGDVKSIIKDSTILSTAEGVMGEDLIIENLSASGETFDTTFIGKAWDGAKNYTYDVFTGNTNVFSDTVDGIGSLIPEGVDSLQSAANYGSGLVSSGSNFIGNIAGDLGDSFASGLDSLSDLTGVNAGLFNDLNIPLLPSNTDLTGAFNGFSNCLLGGSSSIIKTEAEKYIDTAMGRLDRSIYGAKMDIIRVSDNKIFQSLIGSGLDCIAAAGSDVFGNCESDTVDQVVDEMIVGIKGMGDEAIDAVTGYTDTATDKVMSFVKIESPKTLPLENAGDKSYYVR